MVNEYPHRIFIKFENSVLQIPVPPENIAGGTGNEVHVYNIIDFGQVASIGGRKLERIQWESHFPKDYDGSIEVVSEGEHVDPEEWRANIEQTQKDYLTVQVTIANTPIDMRCIIEEFKWTYTAGPFGDIWYQIMLAEFKEGVIREFSGVDFPSVDVRARPFGELPTTYTVREGQSLVDVSIAVYGTTRNYTDLYKANISQIFLNSSSAYPEESLGALDLSESNPEFWSLWKKDDPLPPGMVLRIPEPSMGP